MQSPMDRPPSTKRQTLDHNEAEALAIEGLVFLAEEPGRLDRFLALSGLGLVNLRKAASEPGFLAAILDYFATDEPLLLAFATKLKRDPEMIAKAREILSPPP